MLAVLAGENSLPLVTAGPLWLRLSLWSLVVPGVLGVVGILLAEWLTGLMELGLGR